MSVEDPIFGIDVSVYQRGLDMAAAARMGVRFAVARATIGPFPNGHVNVDPTYHEHVANAREAGLLPGAYMVPVETPAKPQVDAFLEATGDLSGALIMVDFERVADDKEGWDYTPTNDTLKAVLAELRRRLPGRRVILYSGPGFWNGGDPSGPLENYGDVIPWSASYPTDDNVTHPLAYYNRFQKWGWKQEQGFGGAEHRFWQMTGNGWIGGVQVDIDAYRDPLESLHALAGVEPGESPSAPPTGTLMPEPVPDTGKETLEQLVEEAIALGTELVGTPYGSGWAPGTWPDGPSLYARCDPNVHTVSFARQHEMICSALINFLRAHVAGLPAIGERQGDAFPGGTAAIYRQWSRLRGVRPYPPVENTPRGWLVYSPYLGTALAFQGHVGIALGDGKVLEARLPALSNDRTEDMGHRALIAGGALGYTHIIPPSIWMRL